MRCQRTYEKDLAEILEKGLLPDLKYKVIDTIQERLEKETFELVYEQIRSSIDGNILIFNKYYLQADDVYLLFVNHFDVNAMSVFLPDKDIGFIIICDKYIEILHNLFVNELKIKNSEKLKGLIEVADIISEQYDNCPDIVTVLNRFLISNLANYIFFHEFSHLIQWKMAGSFDDIKARQNMMEIDADSFYIKHILTSSLIFFHRAYTRGYLISYNSPITPKDFRWFIDLLALIIFPQYLIFLRAYHVDPYSKSENPSKHPHNSLRLHYIFSEVISFFDELIKSVDEFRDKVIISELEDEELKRYNYQNYGDIIAKMIVRLISTIESLVSYAMSKSSDIYVDDITLKKYYRKLGFRVNYSTFIKEMSAFKVDICNSRLTTSERFYDDVSKSIIYESFFMNPFLVIEENDLLLLRNSFVRNNIPVLFYLWRKYFP